MEAQEGSVLHFPGESDTLHPTNVASQGFVKQVSAALRELPEFQRIDWGQAPWGHERRHLRERGVRRFNVWFNEAIESPDARDARAESVRAALQQALPLASFQAASYKRPRAVSRMSTMLLGS